MELHAGIDNVVSEQKTMMEKVDQLLRSQAPLQGSAQVLPAGWRRLEDATGTPYYEDSNSRTTQWEPPGGAQVCGAQFLCIQTWHEMFSKTLCMHANVNACVSVPAGFARSGV